MPVTRAVIPCYFFASMELNLASVRVDEDDGGTESPLESLFLKELDGTFIELEMEDDFSVVSKKTFRSDIVEEVPKCVKSMSDC